MDITSCGLVNRYQRCLNITILRNVRNCYQTTWRHNPEDFNLLQYRCEKLGCPKSVRDLSQFMAEIRTGYASQTKYSSGFDY
jgi:hypothetical protein